MHSETMEIHMTIATAVTPSMPKQLPLSIQTQATIKWTSPRVVEIAVGLEIDSCAEGN